MRSGYLMRVAQAQDRASDKLCDCGHRTGDHHELKDIWDAEQDDFIRHPDHRPGAFHCDHDCRCILQI